MENNTNFTNPTPPIDNTTTTNSTPLIHKRFWGPSTFGLIILMFFFTFIDIKCNTVSLGKVKGYELATGYHLNTSGGDKHREKPNLFAAGALLMAAVGFGLGFIKAKPGSFAKIICGFLGFLNMVLLYLTIQYDMHKANKNSDSSSVLSKDINIHVDFEMAFWFALLLFIGAIVLGIMQLIKKPKSS